MDERSDDDTESWLGLSPARDPSGGNEHIDVGNNGNFRDDNGHIGDGNGSIGGSNGNFGGGNGYISRGGGGSEERRDVFEVKAPSRGDEDDADDDQHITQTTSTPKQSSNKKKARRGSALRRQLPFFRVQRAATND